MNNFLYLLNGFQNALTPANLIAAATGAFMGLVVGAIPGMGSLAGVSLLLPLTFKMNPTTAIIMLAAIYYANMYGGSFSAILLNIPGDASAVMTTLDGNKMAKKGKAGQALFTAILSSFIGGTIGIILLTFLGPWLAQIGLSFGPAEVAALILLALTSLGWLLGGDPVKGLVSSGIGILLATIGVDQAVGMPRFTFGSINLLSGINFIPLVIGMFGFSQVIDMVAMKGVKTNSGVEGKLTLRDSLLSKKEVKRVVPVALREGFLGTFIGILPGAGATTATFLCYIMEKRINRNKKLIGQGTVEGIAAAEAANNAASAGAFAPLLSLGIPGSGTTAVLLGGLMMWGLKPGPLLFTQNPDFVWGLISSMYVGNMICLAISLLLIPAMVHILRVPISVMIPLISTICMVGAYSISNNMFDVWLMLIAGITAYMMSKHDFPIAPVLLAFVLAPRFEKSITQALDISNGSFKIFVKSPIALGLLILTVIFVILPMFFRKDKVGEKDNT